MNDEDKREIKFLYMKLETGCFEVALSRMIDSRTMTRSMYSEVRLSFCRKGFIINGG
jgi:hypothetical protein